MNQTIVLQYLKNTSQKIRDWIADRLATMLPKDTSTPGRLAATRVTKTEAANAFARALKTGTTRDAMRIPVTLQTTQKKVPVEAFLDCGANECFISQRFIDEHRLGVRYMKTPHKIENANGSPNAGGNLRYYIDLTVTTGTQSHPLQFYITDIGPDNLVLGYLLRPSTRRSRCRISVSRAFGEDKGTQRSSLLLCLSRAEPRRQAWL